MSDAKETTDTRSHRGIEVRLRPVAKTSPEAPSRWTATWTLPEGGMRSESGKSKKEALEEACDTIDNYYLKAGQETMIYLKADQETMIYIEIENKATGALLRIPDAFMYVEETFENSAEDASWDQWTEPVEDELSNIKDWNGEGHFLFGAWEMLCQSDDWARAIESVLKEDRHEFTDRSQVIIRTGRKEI